jgi:hypothetical protein
MAAFSRKNIVLVLIPILLVIMLAVATHEIWVVRKNNVFDFFPRWYGAREMLQGHNPYSVEINKRILDEMGYAVYEPYRHNFLYPATITYILLPFWLIPFPVSISIWSGISLLLFLALPLYVFFVLDWQLKPWLLAVIIFFSAFVFRHAIDTYLIGQFIIFILGCLLLAWLAIHEDRPWLAALALVGATIRPDGVILAGAMLFDLILKRRFNTVIIWTGIMASLGVLSLLQAGYWIPDMMKNVRGYRECCLYAEPSKLIGGETFSSLFIVVVLLWAGWLLWHLRPLPDKTRIPWSLSVVIIAYLLVLPQSKDYTLVYGLLPAWIIIWSSQGRWWSTLLVLAILCSPWIYDSTGNTSVS